MNIRSEQELCYVIYNYPLLCMDGFCSERLYSWIEKELKRKDLAEKLRQSTRMGETAESRLYLILKECNYYDTAEVMSFAGNAAELARLPYAELLRREGLALFKSGSYKQALERFELSEKTLESEFRKQKNDDKALREINIKKAGLYCDMAAARLQMFDERSAIELLEASCMTFKNERAEKMRYLIDGSGELPEETCTELDNMKDELRQKVREGAAYRSVLAIFDNDDKEEVFKEAKALAAEWKKDCRKM